MNQATYYTPMEAAAAGLLAEQRRQSDEAKAADSNAAYRMVADSLDWLQTHTQTKDSHWREAGASTPYRCFPDKPYFRPMVELFNTEPVLFVEKSRDLMLSWLFAGLFTHAVMSTDGIEVLFQSQKEAKAFELVGYARILYERQNPEIKKLFPLSKPMDEHPAGQLQFAHGGRIVGIPGGSDQIRSYHPWGLLIDEAAFIPESGLTYDQAVPVCQKIVVLSSAGPGWFADMCTQGL